MFRERFFNVAIVAAVTVRLATTAFGESGSRGHVIINRGFSAQGLSGWVVQRAAQAFEDKFRSDLCDSRYKQWHRFPARPWICLLDRILTDRLWKCA